MANKIMNARMQQKHDIEEHWNLANNFIPKLAEIIVYDKDEIHNYVRLKIGDGITNIINLPFYNTQVQIITWEEND